MSGKKDKKETVAVVKKQKVWAKTVVKRRKISTKKVRKATSKNVSTQTT